MASIQIVTTGKTYSSSPDRLIGQQLRDGYQYEARLQFLEQNPHLCPFNTTSVQNEDWTVVPPQDGLPGMSLPFQK